MSESFDLLIDPQATLQEAPALAARLLKVLIERGVLEDAPILPLVQDNWKSTAGAKAESACLIDEGDQPTFNEFKVSIGRYVFSHSLSEFAPSHAICRHCEHELRNSIAIRKACTEWKAGSDLALLRCPNCDLASPLKTWDFDGSGGVGNLGFYFWSWPPLRPEFIRQLEVTLGHPLVHVEGRW